MHRPTKHFLCYTCVGACIEFHPLSLAWSGGCVEGFLLLFEQYLGASGAAQSLGPGKFRLKLKFRERPEKFRKKITLTPFKGPQISTKLGRFWVKYACFPWNVGQLL